MDLNVIVHQCHDEQDESCDSPPLVVQKIKTAIKLGFELIALNVVVDSSRLNAKEIKIPEPLTILFEKGDEPNVCVGEGGRKFRVLTRLTAVVTDTLQCHKLMHLPIIKKFDIIAFQPKNEKLFHHVCSTADADIISLDMTSKLPFVLRRQQIGVALQRGLCFEILYAPCIRDQSSRQTTFAVAQSLATVCKGKNIILSSGATKALELRSPNDVINLGELFGLKQNTSRQAIMENCKKVLKHSELRKTLGQAVVSVTDVPLLEDAEVWVYSACSIVDNYVSEGVETASQVTASESPPAKRWKTAEGGTEECMPSGSGITLCASASSMESRGTSEQFLNIQKK